MKITVTTQDGAAFTGTDAADIVRQMRDTQWNAPDKKRDYMAQVAGRVREMTGKLIGPGAAEFLEGLQDAGLVTISVTTDNSSLLHSWLTGSDEA